MLTTVGVVVRYGADCSRVCQPHAVIEGQSRRGKLNDTVVVIIVVAHITKLIKVEVRLVRIRDLRTVIHTAHVAIAVVI